MNGTPDRYRRRDDRGFTLVEILIAIVLVGILSAVVVVGIGNLTSQGSSSACKASADASRAATGMLLVFATCKPVIATVLACLQGLNAEQPAMCTPYAMPRCAPAWCAS